MPTCFTGRRALLPVICLCLLLPVKLHAAATSAAQGRFLAAWGDPFTAGKPAIQRYFLATDDGALRELAITGEADTTPTQLLGFNGMRVAVEVSANGALQRDTDDQLLRVRSIEPLFAAGSTRREQLSGARPWVTIMCKFKDVSSEPENLAYFQQMYSSFYPGLNDYWQESSYNRVNIDGSNAYGWYTLPQSRSFYLSGGTLDFDEISTDCTHQAAGDVRFTDYEGINLAFNANLDGYAWGGFGLAEGNAYRMTWLPPWGYRDITVIVHEMGHGFGMPHSSGNYGLVYDNVWDVMSNPWAYCGSSSDPTYGCLGQHTIGYHRELVGWLHADEIYTHDGTTRTIVLNRITKPLSGGYLLAKVPIGTSTTHYYTAEVRQRIGYDTKLPAEAVVIHEVDEKRSNGRDAYLVDIDNNGNTADGGAIWRVGETFVDSPDDICIAVTGRAGSSYSLRIGCPEKSLTAPSLAPLLLLLGN